VLWAHVLTSLIANIISLVVIVLVALLIGFRSGAGVLAWLAVAGILILFTRQPVSTGIWTALAWCLGILIVAYALATATYHRKIA
jgi:hypothetical protein